MRLPSSLLYLRQLGLAEEENETCSSVLFTHIYIFSIQYLLLYSGFLDSGFNTCYPTRMEPLHEVTPLPYANRRRTFLFLVTVFVVSLPFLYLYATGYRFDPKDPNAIVKTGGMYVAAERTGAEIYIDDELVRETRVFRTAFYAQNLQPKTHKVHVQKEGHNTWVKELPVTSHRVTEAQAFNMPLTPLVRVISEYTSATGSAIVRAPILFASTTNEILATSTKATSTFIANPEYTILVSLWKSTTTPLRSRNIVERVQNEFTSTSTRVDALATTTKISGGAMLSTDENGEVYATWVGNFEQMPYYYCAAPFPRYSTSSPEVVPDEVAEDGTQTLPQEANTALSAPEFIHPVQEVPEDTLCDRRIRLDAGEPISAYDFMQNTTDLVVVELESGIHVMEVDPRAWQNKQPLLLGSNLKMSVENGSIFVYDGVLIYQVIIDR